MALVSSLICSDLWPGLELAHPSTHQHTNMHILFTSRRRLDVQTNDDVAAAASTQDEDRRRGGCKGDSRAAHARAHARSPPLLFSTPGPPSPLLLLLLLLLYGRCMRRQRRRWRRARIVSSARVCARVPASPPPPVPSHHLTLAASLFPFTLPSSPDFEGRHSAPLALHKKQQGERAPSHSHRTPRRCCVGPPCLQPPAPATWLCTHLPPPPRSRLLRVPRPLDTPAFFSSHLLFSRIARRNPPPRSSLLGLEPINTPSHLPPTSTSRTCLFPPWRPPFLTTPRCFPLFSERHMPPHAPPLRSPLPWGPSPFFLFSLPPAFPCSLHAHRALPLRTPIRLLQRDTAATQQPLWTTQRRFALLRPIIPTLLLLRPKRRSVTQHYESVYVTVTVFMLPCWSAHRTPGGLCVHLLRQVCERGLVRAAERTNGWVWRQAAGASCTPSRARPRRLVRGFDV